jgi:hypothetical protein
VRRYCRALLLDILATIVTTNDNSLTRELSQKPNDHRSKICLTFKRLNKAIQLAARGGTMRGTMGAIRCVDHPQVIPEELRPWLAGPGTVVAVRVCAGQALALNRYPKTTP